MKAKPTSEDNFVIDEYVLNLRRAIEECTKNQEIILATLDKVEQVLSNYTEQLKQINGREENIDEKNA